MTPEQMAQELERTAGRFFDAADRAVAETLDAAHALAYEYSSGPYSSRELAQLDHPYATRHGAPQLPPDIINVQRGDVRGGWMAEGPLRSNGGSRGSLWNSSREAEFLQGGTTLMFERPIADRVALEIEPVFQTNLERRMAEVLHG